MDTKATGKVAGKPKKSRNKQEATRSMKSKSGFDREAEEAKLIKKYPKQKIVAGSLMDAGAVPGFGQKRTIEIICQDNHELTRRIATSDLHQVRFSEGYMKMLRTQRRRKKPAASQVDSKPKSGPKTEPKTGGRGRNKVVV